MTDIATLTKRANATGFDRGSHVTLAATPLPEPEIIADPVKPTDLAPPKITREQATQSGFTGNTCATCGSMMMVRNGTCEKCTSCGTTTGCS